MSLWNQSGLKPFSVLAVIAASVMLITSTPVLSAELGGEKKMEKVADNQTLHHLLADFASVNNQLSNFSEEIADWGKNVSKKANQEKQLKSGEAFSKWMSTSDLLDHQLDLFAAKSAELSLSKVEDIATQSAVFVSRSEMMRFEVYRTTGKAIGMELNDLKKVTLDKKTSPSNEKKVDDRISEVLETLVFMKSEIEARIKISGRNRLREEMVENYNRMIKDAETLKKGREGRLNHPSF